MSRATHLSPVVKQFNSFKILKFYFLAPIPGFKLISHTFGGFSKVFLPYEIQFPALEERHDMDVPWHVHACHGAMS